MPQGCSQLKKTICQHTQDCNWVVGKGCRKVAVSPKTVLEVPFPSKDYEVVFSKTVKKKVSSQVHPDSTLSKDFLEISDKFLYFVLRYILQGIKKQVVDVNDLDKTFRSKSFPQLSEHFHRNSIKAAKSHVAVFWSKTFAKKIENLFGKKLTEDAAWYLAGGVEYLYAEIVEMAGNLAYHSTQYRINGKYAAEAIVYDTEFIKLIKLFK